MAVEVSYPGVYVEETASGIHPIEGVSTSTAAFVGPARSGATDTPVHVQSLVAFKRLFGGRSRKSILEHAVRHFFENGGSDALIVRVAAASGRRITDDVLSAPGLKSKKRGLWALEKADIPFN